MVQYNIDLTGKTILVTGAAGFIGSNLVKRLFHDVENIKVIGIDSITDYYDVNIKFERLKEIEAMGKDWTFVHDSIANKEAIEKIFSGNKISVVVNLAAQAGVRYSITNPDAYIQSNLIGFYNILEACRHHEVEQLVYASSSSVYGSNKKLQSLILDVHIIIIRNAINTDYLDVLHIIKQTLYKIAANESSSTCHQDSLAF